MPRKAHGKTLENAVVLITGASDGIGAACAAEFRRRGAKLALTGRSEEKLRRVARPGELAIAADLTSPQSPHEVVSSTAERFGSIDILVNNAGRGLYGSVLAASDAEARALFELNFFAPLAIARFALPYLRSTGGAIANVNSVAGRVPLPWMPLYSASKTALSVATQALRMELKREGIHVMQVYPGYVRTAFQDHALGRPPEDLVEGRRFAITPESCAKALAEGLERRARTVVVPRWAGALMAINRLAPALVENRLRSLLSHAERG